MLVPVVPLEEKSTVLPAEAVKVPLLTSTGPLPVIVKVLAPLMEKVLPEFTVRVVNLKDDPIFTVEPLTVIIPKSCVVPLLSVMVWVELLAIVVVDKPLV